jgi:hypothetical protein
VTVDAVLLLTIQSPAGSCSSVQHHFDPEVLYSSSSSPPGLGHCVANSTVICGKADADWNKTACATAQSVQKGKDSFDLLRSAKCAYARHPIGLVCCGWGHMV